MPRTVNIRLENALGGPTRIVEVSASADADADYLCLPAAIVRRLGLPSSNTRNVSARHGLVVQCRYVGPVLIQVGRASAYTGAVELGDEVVLGKIALGHLGLKIDPLENDLVADPSGFRIGGIFESVA